MAEVVTGEFVEAADRLAALVAEMLPKPAEFWPLMRFELRQALDDYQTEKARQ
jgi:hypothetical protein